MKKALLTHQGYKLKTNDLSDDDKNKIAKDLTIQPESYIGTIKPYRIYKATDRDIYLPRYYGIINFSGGNYKNVKSIFLPGEKANFDFILPNFQLRPLQKVAYKYVLKAFQKYTTAILKLGCGVGKTVLGIYLIQKLCKKTLVIVHRVNLLTQWKDEIEKYTNAKVGLLHRKIIDIEGKDIVLTTIHNVIGKRKRTTKYLNMYKRFGLTIIDEAHHLNMKEFSQTLQIVNTSWMLGLTATPNKGMSMKINHVFKLFIGPVVPPDVIQERMGNKNSNKGNIIANILRYKVNHSQYSDHIIIDYARKPNTAKMVTNIGQNNDRSNVVIQYIKQIVEYNHKNKEPEKRKILVVSDRKRQLRYIHHKLRLLKIDAGLFIGGMTPSGIEDSKSRQVILGTYGVCEEGLNIKDLNTLIINTPRRVCEQMVGRILRRPHKIPAMIVDIIDCFSKTFCSQGCARKKYYKINSYKIKDQNIKDLKILPLLDFKI